VNLIHHDDIYERLLALHVGLDEAESRDLSARLVLILINHIGDENVIYEAFDAARTSGPLIHDVTRS
jgi:Protein of unknown function (DUF2783)